MNTVSRPRRLPTKLLIALAALLVGGIINNAQAGESGTPASQPGIRIVLVGDSTVNDGGGWGVGFKKMLKPGVEVINWAQNGRSSRSFIDEGWWAKALADKPNYVLIQFGHNDQPGKGPKRETDPATTYPQYLVQYIDDSRAIGAKPILVTSMTRRLFGSDGKIHSNLIEYVEAAKKVAAERKTPLIDLHQKSIELLDEIGPKAAEEFDHQNAPKPGKPADTKRDRTHLSPKGSEVMGKLVAEELKKVAPELAAYIK